MSTVSAFRAVFDWLFRRRRERDLDEEIQAHLSMASRDLEEDGMDRDAARLAARKAFGNVTLTREATRYTWGERWRETVRDLLQDVRYAVRVLWRSPGYSLVVIAVLALGIGANASLFSVFKALTLKPLRGVEQSSRLAFLLTRTSAGRITSLSHQDFRDLASQTQAFDSLAGATDVGLRLETANVSRPVYGELVTGNYFSTLGVRAQIGRTLLPSDDLTPGGHPVAVITDAVWTAAFNADRAIVGRSVKVNGQPMTIVGVTEPGFQGTVVSQVVGLFAPAMMQPMLWPPGRLDNRQQPMLFGIGRLKPGTTIDDAAAEAGLLSSRLTHLHPPEQAADRATVVPIWRSPYGAQGYLLPALMPLGAMGALLLLLVCTNVANLVLVRGVSRRGEIAARLALGASRSRIVRLLSIESLVLALPAAALGLWATRSLMLLANDAASGNPDRPFWLDVATDWYVTAFAVALACGSVVVFGLLPALRSSGLELASSMKDDLSPRGGSRGHLRAALLVMQVAVSLVLLVGAGLVLRSLGSVQTATAGIDPANVTVFGLDVSPNGYDEARGRVYYSTLLEAVRTEPGVEAASLASRLPVRIVQGGPAQLAIDGYTPRRDEELRAHLNRIASDYFRTLRVEVLAGREFTQRDDDAAAPVAIVNETLARRFWTTPADAIDKRLRLDGGEWTTVVGVVRDLKYFTLNEQPQPYVYAPFAQMYQPAMTLHVRTSDAGAAALARIGERLAATSANRDITEPLAMSRYLRMQTGIYNIVAIVLAAFGGIALLLAALGTYGVVAYAARQRTHEIGIRIAIGARRVDVLRRFLANGLKLGVWGTAAGAAIALALGRLLAGLLYGVSATDAVSFGAASVAVMVVVLLASLAPAWRASRTDPISALRHR